MAEIYVDTNSPIKTKIFWKGELVSADANVTANVYDVVSYPNVAPSINPTSPIHTVVAEPVEVDYGSYQIFLPVSLTSVAKKLKIVWSYQVGGVNASHTTYADIVKPYVNFVEAMEDLGLGSDPSDPNYKTYHELRMAEKYARKIIEDFTGQSFYTYQDEENAYGTGTETLVLASKINDIYQIYANDVLIYDSTVDPEINNFGADIKISETGFAVRLDRSTLVDNTVYSANGMIPPTIHDEYSGPFRDGVRYKVLGAFGWLAVPDDVEQAAIQLMGHYFAKDRLWADRYLKKVSTFDWDFEYSDQIFSGTGCAYADKLLSDYVLSNMVLI